MAFAMFLAGCGTGAIVTFVTLVVVSAKANPDVSRDAAEKAKAGRGE